MAEKDDSAWIFDSLIGFLQGPIWSAPLLTFIEEKSLIFSPETLDSREYHEVYQEYKNLVDLLLGCYIEDMGITPEQFERACTINKSTAVPIKFQQNLFEQIWATNEYEVFKRMMIQKNLELQLQALKMIEQKFGLTPASLTHETSEIVEDELPIEEILQTEIAEKNENRIDDEVDLNVDRDKRAMRLEHERLAAVYVTETALLKEALKKPTDNSPTPEERGLEHDIDQFNKQKKVFGEDAGSSYKPPTSTPSEKFNIRPKEETKEDICKRQQYLKAQRDKLMALKKQARSQKLEANTVRPSSARIAAEASIDGKQQDFLQTHQQSIDPSILQVRKALAARLKAEVVQK